MKMNRRNSLTCSNKKNAGKEAGVDLQAYSEGKLQASELHAQTQAYIAWCAGADVVVIRVVGRIHMPEFQAKCPSQEKTTKTSACMKRQFSVFEEDGRWRWS